MRLIDCFDRGADLYPERHCLHDGTRGWTCATVQNLHILANTDVALLFCHSSFEPALPRIREACPKIQGFVCLDLPDDPDAVAFLASSGGTTGRPKGLHFTNRNIETMNSILWACLPAKAPPVHLMVAPTTHAAGVCSFPLLLYGGTNIFMGTADRGAKATPDDLVGLAKQKLGGVKAPKSVDFVATPPRSSVGKVPKKDLRAPGRAGRARKI